LLETLKAIQQTWEPAINKAIAAFKKDWLQRAENSAQAITDYLTFAVQLKVEQSVANESEQSRSEAKAIEKYQTAISEREQKLFAQIRRYYHHTVFDLQLPQQSVLREDLFSEATWELLGLTKKQLTLAATGMGAGIGATLDLATGGLSHGLFAAAGAIFAGGSAYLKGSELTRVKVSHLPLGGMKIVVGPNQNPQFPVVLLDRAILYYREIASHAHGNRSGKMPDLNDQSVLRHVTSQQQKQLLKLANKLAKNQYGEIEASKQQLNQLLMEILHSDSDVD